MEILYSDGGECFCKAQVKGYEDIVKNAGNRGNVYKPQMKKCRGNL